MALKSSEVNMFGSYGMITGISIALPLSYLTAFQTEGLGWSAVLATTVLIVPRIIDFIFGVTCGTIMSKVRMPWGRYRSWFLVLRWVVFAGIILQFLNTKNMPMAVQVLCIFLGYGMLHWSMNFIFTSQMGIMFTMGGASLDDRTRLSVRAMQFSMVGSIITSVAMIPSLQALTKFFYPENTNPNWYGANAFMVMAIITSTFFLFGATIVAAAAKPYDKPVVGGAQASAKISDIIKSVTTNGQLLIYTVVTTLNNISMFAVLPLGIFYYMYVLKNMMLMPIAMTVSTLFGFVASIIGPVIGKKLGMKRAMVIGMIIAICGNIVTANFGGIGTLTGLTLAGMAIPVGWCVYVVIMLINSLAGQMYAGFAMQFTVNAAEYGYWKTGKDNRTAALGIGSIPMKIALIVGGALGGYALAGIGYQPGMGTPGGPLFPANFIPDFMKLLGYVPAAISLVSVILFGIGYKISDSDARRYAEENMKKDQEAKAAGSAG